MTTAADPAAAATSTSLLHPALLELARLTAGWDPDRRKAAYVAVLRDLIVQSPGMLAAAVDPTTVQTPALALIDQALADVEAGRTDRLIISMPPQEGKSSRVTRAGALWFLKRDPTRRIGIASYAKPLAEGHGGWCRDIIDVHGTDAIVRGGTDLLGLQLRRTARAAGRWSLAGHRGGMLSIGIGGGWTGNPLDVAFVDDPVKDREQADSPVWQERVWSWWTDVLVPRSPKAVIVVMTRWNQQDLAGRLLVDQPGRWRVLNIPAQCEDPATDPLARPAGAFMLSARGRTDAEWEAKKLEVGARSWAALFQGRPAPAEGGIFQWAWIRPYRVPVAPALARVVVAVDPTGGGHDEAGIIVAGRGPDQRTYVVEDRSGPYTAGGQWRVAWLTVLDHEADQLVYEANLVDPVQRKAIPAAWRRMRDQAAALAQAGLLDDDADTGRNRLLDVAARLAGTGDDDVQSATVPPDALADQLEQLLPYAARILEATESGPARVTPVHATRGKRTRAEPMSQAYETGRVSHVGMFPDFEAELVTWQEGQDSPNRLDAGVWAWTALNSSLPARTSRPAGRVQTGPTSGVVPGGIRRGR